MAYSPTFFTSSMQHMDHDQEEMMGDQTPPPPVSAPPLSRSGLPLGFSLRNNVPQPAVGKIPTSASFDNIYQRSQPAQREYDPTAPSMVNQMFSPFPQPQPQPFTPSNQSASLPSMPLMDGLSLSSTSNKKRLGGSNGGVINLRSSTMSPDSVSSTPMLPELSGSRSPLLSSSDNTNRVDIHTMSDEQHFTYIQRRGPVVYYNMNDSQLTEFKMEHLYGLQDVENCLDQNIVEPLRQPEAYRLPGLYQSMLWLDGKAGCGMRSAILAKLQGVCNVLIYRTVDDGKLPDEMFFVDMLLFAIRKSPCAVVIHRADAAFAARQTKAPGDKLPEGVRMTDKVLKAYALAWKRMIDTTMHNRIWSIHVQQFNPSLYDNYYRSFFVAKSRAIAKVADMRDSMDYTINIFKLLLCRYLEFSENKENKAYVNKVSVIIKKRLIECKQNQPKLEFVKRPRDLLDIITDVILNHRATSGMTTTLPGVDLFGTALERKKEMVQQELETRMQGEQLKA